MRGREGDAYLKLSSPEKEDLLGRGAYLREGAK